MNTDKFEWTDALVIEYVNSLISPLERIGKGIENGITGYDSINRFKSEKTAFITEDGESIYFGAPIVWINEKLELEARVFEPPHPKVGYRYFSSPEAASLFILENTPILSVHEVFLAMTSNIVEHLRDENNKKGGRYIHGSNTLETLRELAKTKLNNK